MSTVSEVLTAATDSVTLINNVKNGSYNVADMTQTQINEMVQRNVDHLEFILEHLLMQVIIEFMTKQMAHIDFSLILAGMLELERVVLKKN